MKKISDFNNATEKYPVVYAGSATRPEFVDMPTILQQQEGVAPMDTCPAQWWNAMWKLATKDINAFRDYVGDAFTEINNLLTEFGITLDDADSEQLYDFFHDSYVQNYLSGIFVNKNGDTIDGDLHIKGDLSVDGIGEEIISTELKVGANTITLRNDNPSALGNTELAGVVTENYDGQRNNNIIAVDANGNARVGDIDIATRLLYSNDGNNFFEDEDLTVAATIGQDEVVRDTGNTTSGGVKIYEGTTFSNDNTQPMATREEEANMIGGYGVTWNAQKKCLETTFIPSGAVIPQNIQADTTITGIVADKCVYITAASAVTLTIGNASQPGIKIRIINTTSLTHTLSLASVSINVPHILPMANVEIMWNGTAWQHVGGCAVGETFEQKPQCDSPFDVFPCSGWVELISHNGAFYRSANAPTTLYTLNAVNFYADVERLNPVDWSGIKNADGTPGMVTDTGNTQFNSRSEEMKIYTGSWTGTGKAAEYLKKTDYLIVQNDQMQGHKHNITGAQVGQGGGSGWFVAGNQLLQGQISTPVTDGVNGTPRTGTETRPINFTIKVWKRTA